METPGHGTSHTSVDLFGLLWVTLADIVGTAATATLLRRAARLAASETPELDELVISREGMAYRYEVPPGWRRTGDGERAFRELIHALGPLLVDLTGPIVIRRLAQLEPLLDRGMLSMEEVAAWLRGERQRPETPERPRPAWPDDVTYDQS